MPGTHSRDFSHPDETRPFKAHGHLDVLSFGKNTTIGRGVFEKGWKWSNDVKPLAGTKSCQTRHAGYCVAGHMTVLMDDGERIALSPGQAFSIAPGHDAWTEGDADCVLIDVGLAEYAKPH
jgi:hypothetical protein